MSRKSREFPYMFFSFLLPSLLLCVRVGALYYSFNPHNDSVICILLLSPFYRLKILGCLQSQVHKQHY